MGGCNTKIQLLVRTDGLKYHYLAVLKTKYIPYVYNIYFRLVRTLYLHSSKGPNRHLVLRFKLG